MYAKIRFLVAAAAAVVVLAAATGSACAASLGFEQNRLRIISIGLVTFREPVIEARCSVTLGGTLHRGLINKAEGILIGFITEAAIEPCSRQGADLLTETLPWHVQYVSITGTLPSAVTSFTIRVVNMHIETVVCLFAGSETYRLADTGSNPYTGEELVDLEAEIPYSSGAICPESIKMRGWYRLEPKPRIRRN